VRELVDRYRGVEKTKSVAKDFILRARSSISSLPESSCKDSLLMLAEYVAERRS
jgi:geranylgeranyl pyrophosphate synthase